MKKQICVFCGTDLEVEREMNSLEPLFTGHSCKGRQEIEPEAIGLTLEEAATIEERGEASQYVPPPIQPDYYDKLEAGIIVTGKEDKHWRKYDGSQMSANAETLIRVLQAGYGRLPAGFAVWLYVGRN